MAIRLIESITIAKPIFKKDASSFAKRTLHELHQTRAYREVRHASSAWVNRASYSKADVLFRIRTHPNITVTTDMVITDAYGIYEIDSVEVLGGRYLEILAHETKAQGGEAHGKSTDTVSNRSS